jgi:HSP20 family protein
MTLLKRASLLPSTSSLFNDLFDDDRFMNYTPGNEWSRIPSANVIEDDNEFKIELAAPGMKKGDFKVDIDNGKLTISSEKEEEKEEKGDTYTRREFSFNSFCRSFLLPDSVDADKIKAKYEDGILRFDLPKKPEAKTLKIKKAIAIS